MEKQLNFPKSLNELTTLMDEMYQTTIERIESGKKPIFNGLLEIATSEAVILLAIHNIKSNSGSKTPGIDNLDIQRSHLNMDYSKTIDMVRKALYNYNASPVKRVHIPKPGSDKMRPLGIPTTTDRIIQECIRITIEPILEAQFFNHSYGFRPMRCTMHALRRTEFIISTTGYNWIVEGDIKGFFDNVNHNVLINKLHRMGICDKRVLMVIKTMLKAGVMNETARTELGTPQGGVISPLLANVYLHSFDIYMSREWEEKETKFEYAQLASKNFALKKTNLKPCYFIRYADDWVLVTNSRVNAEKLKFKAEKYLRDELKLELSPEKTLITDVLNKRIKFLGFEIKAERRNGRRLITRTYANEQRLVEKVNEIISDVRKLRTINNPERVIGGIFAINSKIRGLNNYYKFASHITKQTNKQAYKINYLAYKMLKRNENVKVTFAPCTVADNLRSIHQVYNAKVPIVHRNDMKIALTNLGFINFDKGSIKSQKETPYSIEGRDIHLKRTGKIYHRQLNERVFELADNYIPLRQRDGLYNFEYHLNRPYAYNRDKGKCRCCGTSLNEFNIHVHHINPREDRNKVNKLINLACVCSECHHLIHNNKELIVSKSNKKIIYFREKINYKDLETN